MLHFYYEVHVVELLLLSENKDTASEIISPSISLDATHDQHFPSESEECAAFSVGFAEHCGDSLTHMVLDADTFKIIYRSATKPRTLKNPNKRLVEAGREEDHQPHSKTR